MILAAPYLFTIIPFLGTAIIDYLKFISESFLSFSMDEISIELYSWKFRKVRRGIGNLSDKIKIISHKYVSSSYYLEFSLDY